MRRRLRAARIARTAVGRVLPAALLVVAVLSSALPAEVFSAGAACQMACCVGLGGDAHAGSGESCHAFAPEQSARPTHPHHGAESAESSPRAVAADDPHASHDSHTSHTSHAPPPSRASDTPHASHAAHAGHDTERASGHEESTPDAATPDGAKQDGVERDGARQAAATRDDAGRDGATRKGATPMAGAAAHVSEPCAPGCGAALTSLTKLRRPHDDAAPAHKARPRPPTLAPAHRSHEVAAGAVSELRRLCPPRAPPTTHARLSA